MINFLLGFLLADFLFNLLLYFNKDFFLSLNSRIFLVMLVIDFCLFVIIFVIKYLRFRNKGQIYN